LVAETAEFLAAEGGAREDAEEVEEVEEVEGRVEEEVVEEVEEDAGREGFAAPDEEVVDWLALGLAAEVPEEEVVDWLAPDFCGAGAVLEGGDADAEEEGVEEGVEGGLGGTFAAEEEEEREEEGVEGGLRRSLGYAVISPCVFCKNKNNKK
jgi:hypothetical protein